MLRPKYVQKKGRKVLLIRCFYCRKEFEYVTSFICYINRAYCKECMRPYLKGQRNAELHRRYLQYLEGVRNQFRQKFRRRDNLDDIILYTQDGRLFRGQIEIGEIKHEDEKFIYVQKFPLSTICLYRKEYIEKL